MHTTENRNTLHCSTRSEQHKIPITIWMSLHMQGSRLAVVPWHESPRLLRRVNNESESEEMER